jgi:hypothetical protein
MSTTQHDMVDWGEQSSDPVVHANLVMSTSSSAQMNHAIKAWSKRRARTVRQGLSIWTSLDINSVAGATNAEVLQSLGASEPNRVIYHSATDNKIVRRNLFTGVSEDMVTTGLNNAADPNWTCQASRCSLKNGWWYFRFADTVAPSTHRWYVNPLTGATGTTTLDIQKFFPQASSIVAEPNQAGPTYCMTYADGSDVSLSWSVNDIQFAQPTYLGKMTRPVGAKFEVIPGLGAVTLDQPLDGSGRLYIRYHQPKSPTPAVRKIQIAPTSTQYPSLSCFRGGLLCEFRPPTVVPASFSFLEDWRDQPLWSNSTIRGTLPQDVPSDFCFDYFPAGGINGGLFIFACSLTGEYFTLGTSNNTTLGHRIVADRMWCYDTANPDLLWYSDKLGLHEQMVTT